MAKKQQKSTKLHDMECTTEYPCEMGFTPEELAEKRDRLVDCIKEEESISFEKKEVTAEYNKKINGLFREERDLCDQILKKSENRTETCKVRYNFDKGEKYVIHPQTGDIIKTMPTDLDDIVLKEEWEKSKKKEVKQVTLALSAGETVIDAEIAEDKKDEKENNEEIPF